MNSFSTNFEHNKSFWSYYAETWDKLEVNIENPDINSKQREEYIQYLGDEWGKVEDVNYIVNNYIYPYVNLNSVAAEIGIGGGRIASKVAGKVSRLYGFDISQEMLKQAKTSLSNKKNISYILLDKPNFPKQFRGKFDFVYSFDVFVHFDTALIWTYLNEIRSILKNNGKVFLHTTDISTPDGWKRFLNRQNSKREGLYYPISRDIIRLLAKHSNFSVIKSSTAKASNFYLNRDFLFVLKKN